MPRYFFHYHIGQDRVQDLDGSVLPDLAAARAEAVQNARDLMSEAVRRGFDISHRTYQICDESGVLLATLPFASSITPRD